LPGLAGYRDDWSPSLPYLPGRANQGHGDSGCPEHHPIRAFAQATTNFCRFQRLEALDAGKEFSRPPKDNGENEDGVGRPKDKPAQSPWDVSGRQSRHRASDVADDNRNEQEDSH
jgi:hypothetical protein